MQEPQQQQVCLQVYQSVVLCLCKSIQVPLSTPWVEVIHRTNSCNYFEN